MAWLTRLPNVTLVDSSTARLVSPMLRAASSFLK